MQTIGNISLVTTVVYQQNLCLLNYEGISTIAIIAIYAAVIATLSFLWQIFLHIKNHRGNLKVHLNVYTFFNNNSQVENIGIEITNIGISDRYVKQPTFVLKKKCKKDKYFGFYNLENITNYPILIKSGELKTLYWRIDKLKEEDKQKLNVGDYLQVRITDTKGKKYQSNKLIFPLH